MNITIRRMKRDDVDQVAILDRECHSLGEWGAEQFHRGIKDKLFLAVAEADGRIIGYIAAACEDDGCYICRIGVDQSMRQQGVGKRLVHECFRCLNRKREKLSVILQENETGVMDFFRRCSFRVWKINRGKFPENGEDTYLFGITRDVLEEIKGH